jgi:hypothetical protein
VASPFETPAFGGLLRVRSEGSRRKVRRRLPLSTLSMNTPLGVFMAGVQCRLRLLTLMVRSAKRVSNHEAPDIRVSSFETPLRGSSG